MRRMVAETRLHPADLVLPAFVREDISEPVEIGSMPGVYQHTRDTLRKAAAEAVAERVRAAGRRALAVAVDTADAASVDALFDEAATLGTVTGLVNNAGLADAVGGKYFHEIDVATWDRIMTVNARGPWLVARALLPHLLAGGGGRIVNVASDAALYGSPRLAHYIASKGALIALTRAMARETGEQGVTVNAVAPGLTESESAERIPAERHELYRLNRAIPRPQRPDDLTGLIAFLIGEESRYITGQTFAVNGGFTMH